MRHYDPTYGRFMSVDPLWKAYVPFSPYAYCRNNPLSRTDASGLGDEPVSTKPIIDGILSGKGVPVTSVIGMPTRPGPVAIKTGELPNREAYNCHSWAWSYGMGDPNDEANADIVGDFPKWDNNPLNNAAESAYEIPFDSPNRAGDRIIYFAEGENGETVPTHSAIVVAVDECGNTTMVSSKWGESYLLLHHPRDVPPAYGQDEAEAVTSTGVPYQSRKYFRMISKEKPLSNPLMPNPKVEE